MKKDIVVLVGTSATGKDTILNRLVEDYGFHKMVSYTTRPKRPFEVEGRDYHFTDNDTFEKLWSEGEMFERTEYKNVDSLWLYGLGSKSICEDKINVTILNPHGLEQLMDSPLANRVISFLIETPLLKRYERYGSRLGREMNEKEKCEAWDRLGRDLRDFRDFKECDFTLKNNFPSDIEQIARIIYKYRLALSVNEEVNDV